MQGSLKTKEFNFEMYKESDFIRTLNFSILYFIIVFTKPIWYNFIKDKISRTNKLIKESKKIGRYFNC